ncbi:MAG: nicotinate-nucleotide--dimethylbenzimidazole phosphoribosyltransferase [Kofleriaceae bacterium]|nr:nicotinate-nucleotide--dimethylbenzimidazole phosphoribosyltransferase [Kofleriaceae bacterium]
MSGPRAVIDHVIAAISPGSEAQAAGARLRLGNPEPGSLAELAIRLAAARHAPAPRTARKALIVVLAEHGCADPGVDLGDAHPAVIAARAIDAGDAAVAAAARAAGARVVLVEAGLATRAALPASVIRMSSGRGAADVTVGAASTPVDVLLAVQSGVAVATALADDGLDVLALGHVAPGAEVAAAAVVARLAGVALDEVAGDADRADVAAALAAAGPVTEPLEVLAALGGGDLAFLTGVILAAASMDVPVVLEDHGTSAAALVAARLAPAVPAYLIAAHGGTRPSHRRALAALGLSPLFALGVGSGEGAGAALALGLIDGAARLLA